MGKCLDYGSLDSRHPADMSPCKIPWESRLAAGHTGTVFCVEREQFVQDSAFSVRRRFAWLREAFRQGQLSRAALGRGVFEREDLRNPKGECCTVAAREALPELARGARMPGLVRLPDWVYVPTFRGEFPSLAHRASDLPPTPRRSQCEYCRPLPRNSQSQSCPAARSALEVS